MSSSARLLEPSTEAFMAQRFNHDFSAVRVHDDHTAGESARSLNARAYTVGNDVVFGHGTYRPESSAGRRLLAHELAHVVQQSRGGPSALPIRDSSLEHAADHAVSAIGGPGPVAVAGASSPGLSRVFGPESLNRAVDPATMSEVQLHREIDLISRWVKDNPSDVAKLAPVLAGLKEELGRRPSPGLKAVRPNVDGGPGKRPVAEFRFPLHPIGETSSNTPPPATAAPRLPRTPPPTYGGPVLDLPGPLGRDEVKGADKPKPKPETKSDPKPEPKPEPKPTAEAKPAAAGAAAEPGLGLQRGIGGQTNLRGPHQPFVYTQVSAEWSNKFFGPELKGSGDLGPLLSRSLKSVQFLGEPGVTFQLHALGASKGAVDFQFLAKLVQLSLAHVDVSLVGGVGYDDIFAKPSVDRLAPLGGLEVEPKIFKSGPVELSWVVDGLATYSVPDSTPAAAGKPAPPPPSRRPDAQFSGELRLKIGF